MNLSFRLVVMSLAAAFVALPLHASLGQNLPSVEADRAEMQGLRRVSEGADYSVHELKSPTGTVVREYLTPDGRVFGIAWQGPFIPNLRQLLGSYFEPYRLAAQDPKARRPGHGPLVVSLPGLVVESSGRMRAFHGRAYLPDLVPPGAAEEGIQ